MKFPGSTFLLLLSSSVSSASLFHEAFVTSGRPKRRLDGTKWRLEQSDDASLYSDTSYRRATNATLFPEKHPRPLKGTLVDKMGPIEQIGEEFSFVASTYNGLTGPSKAALVLVVAISCGMVASNPELTSSLDFSQVNLLHDLSQAAMAKMESLPGLGDAAFQGKLAGWTTRFTDRVSMSLQNGLTADEFFLPVQKMMADMQDTVLPHMTGQIESFSNHLTDSVAKQAAGAQERLSMAASDMQNIWVPEMASKISSMTTQIQDTITSQTTAAHSQLTSISSEFHDRLVPQLVAEMSTVTTQFKETVMTKANSIEMFLQTVLVQLQEFVQQLILYIQSTLLQQLADSASQVVKSADAMKLQMQVAIDNQANFVLVQAKSIQEQLNVLATQLQERLSDAGVSVQYMTAQVQDAFIAKLSEDHDTLLSQCNDLLNTLGAQVDEKSTRVIVDAGDFLRSISSQMKQTVESVRTDAQTSTLQFKDLLAIIVSQFDKQSSALAQDTSDSVHSLNVQLKHSVSQAHGAFGSVASYIQRSSSTAMGDVNDFVGSLTTQMQTSLDSKLSEMQTVAPQFKNSFSEMTSQVKLLKSDAIAEASRSVQSMAAQIHGNAPVDSAWNQVTTEAAATKYSGAFDASETISSQITQPIIPQESFSSQYNSLQEKLFR